MIIGIPKEIKSGENRVGLLPHHVKQLIDGGHHVIVQHQAGMGISIDDAKYLEAGASIVPTIEDVYKESTLIVKVKEPQPSEYGLLQPHTIMFTYLHAAGNGPLCQAFIQSKATGIAYETITAIQSGERPILPLLRPMSEVAGRLATQVASQYLHQRYGGKGILLGGVTGTRNGNVLVIGAGIVGNSAIEVAVGLGCNVTVIDQNIDALSKQRDKHGNRVQCLMMSQNVLENYIKGQDVIIGSVLLPGEQAPKLVTREMVKNLVEPGTVMVDVAIDQGGCFETSRATTHENPIFIEHDVIHYCVANMPSAVARTATEALTNATFPYILRIANDGIPLEGSFLDGINFYNGHVTHQGVARSIGVDYCYPYNTICDAGSKK